MEEEANVAEYIVGEKLPRQLESTRKAVEGLQKVTGQQALGQVRRESGWCLIYKPAFLRTTSTR